MITEKIFDIIEIKGKIYPKFRRLTFTGEKKTKIYIFIMNVQFVKE